MKPLFSSLILYALLLMFACQDSREIKPVADTDRYKKIGEQIPNETADRWIELYAERNNTSGRDLLSSYSITRASLETLRQSVDVFVGIAFHHGIDADGEHHFLLVPIDETLHVWEPIDGRAIIDANTNLPIDYAQAEAWAVTYQTQSPGTVWFHFFGADIFDDITDIPYFQDMDIVPAVSDLDLSPQLLLVVSNGDTSASGKLANEDDTFVYDMSSPCPPCDVH